MAAGATAHRPTQAEIDVAVQRMGLEGYFQSADPDLAALANGLADAVSKLAAMDLPPVLLFLFDEAWLAFYRQHLVLRALIGADYQVMPDFWVWRIDPKAGEAGWRPHRDIGRRALDGGGRPLSLTVWIPLTPATPQNGCIYLLPANRDPVYNTSEESHWQIDLPSIRAAPAMPGEFLCWNQSVLHWGGQSSSFAERPRISMALEFQRNDVAPFNKPLLGALPNLRFETRLWLVAKQMLQYQHMYPLRDDLRTLAREILS